MCLSVTPGPQLLSVPGGASVSSDGWEAHRALSRGTRRKAGAAGEPSWGLGCLPPNETVFLGLVPGLEQTEVCCFCC